MACNQRPKSGTWICLKTVPEVGTGNGSKWSPPEQMQKRTHFETGTAAPKWAEQRFQIILETGLQRMPGKGKETSAAKTVRPQWSDTLCGTGL